MKNPSPHPLLGLLLLLLASALATPVVRAQCLGGVASPVSFPASFAFDECRTNPYPFLIYYKSANYQQSGPGSVTFQTAGLGSLIMSGRPPAGDAFRQVQGAAIRNPGCPAGTVWLRGPDTNQVFGTREALDRAAPAGNYTFTLNAGGAQSTRNFTLPANAWPTLPLLENYAEAQNIDATQPFVIRLAADAVNARTTIQYLPEFGIPTTPRDCNPVSSAIWTLPANALQPGTAYRLYIRSVRLVGSLDAPTAPGLTFQVTVSTQVRIRTREAAPTLAIVTQPADATIAVGGSATLSVQAEGPAPLTYRWYKDGLRSSSAKGNSWTISKATKANSGIYKVTVSSSAGTVVSRDATVLVLIPPSITSQPASISRKLKQKASFSVKATGNGPFSYQWYHKGTQIAANATASTYTIASVTRANAGDYTVKVKNAVGTVTSKAATLTIIP